MSSLNYLEQIVMVGILIYAISATGIYLAINLIALDTLREHLKRRPTREDQAHFSGMEPPISVIVPAYNEGTTIVASLQSIMKLDYPGMEVVVVNDGSKDDTLEVLLREFDFEQFPEAKRLSISCKPIRAVYLSRRLDNLRLIDKENGGKADAINAGINLSRSPLFCCIDADSLLEPEALAKVVQPFVLNRDIMATGGTVRVANGSTVTRGHVTRQRPPRNLLALFQFVEYIRGFLFGRLGWSRIKGLLIVSGAFGVFHKEKVIETGGYATGTIGEDMELILRMYKTMIKKGRSHDVEFVPDAVCWTEAPETLKVFSSQRKRWHRGLSESLENNTDLLFGKNTGTIGWLAYPFFTLIEWLSPFVELIGYLFTAYLLLMQKVTLLDASLLLCFAVLLSVFISVLGLFLDQLLFPGSMRARDVLILTLTTVAECFGYRQLNMVYKIQGAYGWMTKAGSSWGEMTRVGFGQK
ncbi:MAG: glycosyltransferase family 2 protein [Gammaproteobacteria bacterium]|nr:glycosyltransferase family 2 protein [Gammaproteobacteria bacterium]